MLGRSISEKNDPKPVVDLIKKTLKVYPYVPGGYGTSIGSALQGKATLARTLDHKLDWEFLKPQEPVRTFTEGTGKVMMAIIAGKKNLRLLLAGGLPDPKAPGSPSARSPADFSCRRATTASPRRI